MYVKLLGVWQEVESTSPDGHVLLANGVTVSASATLYPAPTDASPVNRSMLTDDQKTKIKSAQKKSPGYGT